MSEASALIQLQNVSKIFYTDEVETHALDGIDLSIHPGEYVAISGPSGCGKSTLLSILGLLDSPTTGDYTLNGQPVAQLSQAERAWTRNREVGFIFQSFNLIGDLTVYENVELPLTYRGMKRPERHERVNEALDKVEMAPAPGTCRASSRGASSSAWRWRGQWPGSRPSCWPTSRPATSILRSKTPDLVLQEVHGLMLAHYAVRRLIHEAARKVDEDPDRLSFVHAVRVVRRRVENPGVSPLVSE